MVEGLKEELKERRVEILNLCPLPIGCTLLYLDNF